LGEKKGEGGFIHRPVGVVGVKMASTLKALWGIGLRSTSFLQSLFLFPFSAVLRAIGLLPNFHQTNQPILPCSTSDSGSSSPPREPHYNGASDADHRNNTDMAIPSSSSLAAKPQFQQENDPKMESAKPHTTISKGNQKMAKASLSKTDSQLSDSLASLTLDGTDKTTTTPSTSLQDSTKGTESAADDVFDGSIEGGMVRAAPVPLAPSISLTSRPKEDAATTIELDGETVQVQPKVETPAQLAERAMHSRFMREALDMVSCRRYYVYHIATSNTGPLRINRQMRLLGIRPDDG